MILRALISAGLAAAPTLLAPTVLTASLTCQEPPALLATSQYLFIVRGDWVYQYDVNTLLLKGRAAIPASGATGRRSPRRATNGIGTIGIDERSDRGTPAGDKPRRAKPKPAQPVIVDVTEERPLMGGAGGRYGSRGGGRGGKGGGKPTATAIGAALNWLAKHQDKNGRWDADGFMKHDTSGTACDGGGSAAHDVGVTGLAMLAMLGDGSTLRGGPYKEQLKLAARWLQDQQGPNGRFGSNASHDFIYDHAIAAYAMCEAYGLSNYKLLKQSAQKGINYLESHRNPYSMWRYQPRDNDNDLSVTSWCLLAYKSAEFFKLQVNQNAIKLGETYLDQVSTPDGRHGYTKQGERSSRMPGDHATRFPTDKCETLTAAGLFCRYFIGQDPDSKPVMKAAADLLIQKPPRWDTNAGTIDHYYWYYGTYAMYQAGGMHWKNWSKHLKSALLPTQYTEGNAAGSWDPAGVWGTQGGRVYSTAMSTLSLEAYYRYSRLVR
ncbi:MAG: hypothetical protein ACI85K_002104 [Hyphomicrobiaceae bacterium]|jgi:hypothetical protein